MADGEKEMDLVSSRFADVITTREPEDDQDFDLDLHRNQNLNQDPERSQDPQGDKDFLFLSSNQDRDQDSHRDRDQEEDQDRYKEPTIPRNLEFCNCPEKITFVLDITREPGATPYQLRNRQTYSATYVIKRALEIFLNVKSTIDKRHQYAVVVINEGTMQPYLDFGMDVAEIQEKLRFLDKDCVEESCEGTFQPWKLFRYLAEQVRTDRPCVERGVPSFVHRVVLIYTRSYCMPQLDAQFLRFYREELANEQTFFLDVMYVHENVDDKNMCQDIYRALGHLDIQGLSYILEVGRNPACLYAAFAKLVSHPLLRPVQDDACYVARVPEGPHSYED